MGSTEDQLDVSKKRSVEDLTGVGSGLVPVASERCLEDIEAQPLPGDAARKRRKAETPDPHPPRISAAFAHDKGSRVDMEDVCIILPSTSRNVEMADGDQQSRVSFFAVFDGHGGVNVATSASEELHRHVLAAGLEKSSDAKSRRKAVAEGFQRTDTALLERCKQHQWQDGATCAAVWIDGDSVVVANLGDAKCVLGRMPPDGGDIKAITLTREHKAIYPQERTRIEKSGGFVSKDGRLGGRIEVSRSFGDPSYKDAGMSAAPDIKVFNITERDRFLLLGCDGFFGVFNPDEAAAAVMRHIDDGRAVKNLCERLINEAVRVRRCTDNCSVLAIIFHHNA